MEEPTSPEQQTDQPGVSPVFAATAMAASPYRVSATRIGNSSGLRLPARFYRDHAQSEGASGQVEGDRNDGHAAFTRMVRRGDCHGSWPELHAEIEPG